MAKIEMDLSEYERMMEVKNLLEKSLENERKLTDEIDKLTQEKIKALKDAEKRVVKITRKESVEYPVQLRDNYEITRSILTLLGASPSSMINTNLRRLDYTELADVFFEKSKVFNHPDQESITTHGLDEIESDIEKSLRKEFENDISRLDEIKKENQDLKHKLERSKIQERHQVEVNDILIKDTERFRNIIESLRKDIDKYEEVTSNINYIAVRTNFWNMFQSIEKIKDLLK